MRKKYKTKNNKKSSSIRFPEKMKYNSCTKDMTLHVLVNKVLKLNTQPLRNDFLGQKNSLSVQALYSPRFLHGFPDYSAKLNRPPLKESTEPRFSLQELLEMSGRLIFARGYNLFDLCTEYVIKHICILFYPRANWKIRINGLLVDDWYNLYDLCTRCISNCTHVQIGMLRKHLLRKFFIDSYFVSEMRVLADEEIF